MANTPKYTFVSPNPWLPALTAANSAIGGVLQEKAASDRQRDRYKSMARILGEKGFTYDAQVYEQMALQESPDFTTAALTGKAVTRDLSMPFEHVLKVLEKERDRDATLEAAGLRARGATGMSRLQLTASDRLLSDQVQLAKDERSKIETELLRLDEKIAKAASEGREDLVETYQSNKDVLQTRYDGLTEQIGKATRTRSENLSRFFSDENPSVGNVTDLDLPTKISPDSAGGRTTERSPVIDERPSLFPDIELPAGAEEEVIPEGKAVPIPRTARAFAGYGLAEPPKVNPIVEAFQRKNPPRDSVTETPQSVEEMKEENLDIEPTKPPANASARAKDRYNMQLQRYRARQVFQSKKENAIIQYGELEAIKKASNIDELNAAIAQANRFKDKSGGFPTEEEAIAAGERARKMMPDGEDFSTVVKRDFATGFHNYYHVKKGSGLRQVGENLWIKDDTNQAFTYDKDGFVVQINPGGVPTRLKDPDNPNASVTKGQWEQWMETLKNSPFSSEAPSLASPTTKQEGKGLTNPKDSLYKRFKTQDQE